MLHDFLWQGDAHVVGAPIPYSNTCGVPTYGLGAAELFCTTTSKDTSGSIIITGLAAPRLVLLLFHWDLGIPLSLPAG